MNIQELSANYKLDQPGIDIVKKARLMFLCGVVAAGKDTILEQVLKNPDYRRLITHTTRLPRANNGIMEQNGINYYFVSVSEMADLLVRHQMVEINNFGGNYYGACVAEIEKANDAGKVIIAAIDVHGVRSFRDIAPDNVTAVFIVPPDYDTWIKRLDKRYDSRSESLAQIWRERSGIAVDEINHALNEPGYHFIVNDDLAETVSELDKIVSRASRGEKIDDFAARQVAIKLLADIKAHT